MNQNEGTHILKDGFLLPLAIKDASPLLVSELTISFLFRALGIKQLKSLRCCPVQIKKQNKTAFYIFSRKGEGK